MMCIRVAQPALAHERISINVNETISDTLAADETVTYLFRAPLTQDIIIHYEAASTVWYRYVVNNLIPTDMTAQITPIPVGDGSDSPTTRTVIIPAYELENVETEPTSGERLIEFTLIRVGDTESSYSFSAYTVSPTAIHGNEPQQIVPSADAPFQVLSVESDFAQSFSVQAEETANDGAFMWVAYLTKRPNNITIYEETTPILPPNVDTAYADNGVIRSMQLFYVGGNHFRIVIKASESYMLNYTPLVPIVLTQSQTVTLSYETPVQLLSFYAPDSSSVTLDAAVIQGEGVAIWLYEGELFRDGLYLGDSNPNPNVPVGDLANTLTVPVQADGQMTLVMQVPPVIDKSLISVDIQLIGN